MYMGIPKGIYERYKYIVLTADVIFVNGIAFLVSLFRGIRLYTCEHVPNRKVNQLAKFSRRIVNLYAQAGGRLCTYYYDGHGIRKKIKNKKV